MRSPLRVIPVLLAATLVAACTGDDTGPLFPTGSTPAPPSTTVEAPSTSDEPTSVPETGPVTTAQPSTTAVVSVPPTAPGTTPPAAHPLDGLTPEELDTFRGVLDADGKLQDSQFPYIGLAEPDKAFVLDWKPGDPFDRQVFAVAQRGDVTYETVVDLTNRRVVSWTAVPGAPGYVNAEFGVAATAARNDERMLAGIAARGLRMNDLICLVFAGGSANGPTEVGHRIGRVTCYVTGSDSNYFSRPVEGLFATVDVDTGEVLSVTDTGAVPVPPDPTPVPDPQRQRPPLTEIGFESSSGADLRLDGYGVEWAGWSLRWRGDQRTGVQIADVRFDGGDGPRRVVYEGYLADLFVPYQDPDPAWAFRTLLDSAEFGLGTTLSALQLGIDCPKSAALLDVPVPASSGAADVKVGGACIFERPTGDPAWRHDGPSEVGPGATETELVLRWISTIGNYDYIVDYVFGADGAIDFHVFAAGIVLQKGVDASTVDEAHAAGVDEHGVLVGDGLLAVNHDHYMSFRLDLDVGDTANRVVKDRIVPETITDNAGRTQVWKVQQDVIASELAALYTPNPQAPARIVVQSSQADGPLGHHPGYEIDFGDAVAVAPGDVGDEPGMRRGGWAEHTLWVTPNAAGERFASGLYVPDGTQVAGLPLWTAQDRSLVDTDLVVWFTVGFHHIVRTEDLPQMPAHEASFAIRPVDVYPNNPFLDLLPR